METAMTALHHRPKLPPRLDFIPPFWGFIHILRHGMRAVPFAGDMPQSAGRMHIRTESPDHLVQPKPTIHSIPPQGEGHPSHAARGGAPLHRFIRRQALRRPSHSLSRCVLVRSSKMGCRKNRHSASWDALHPFQNIQRLAHPCLRARQNFRASPHPVYGHSRRSGCRGRPPFSFSVSAAAPAETFAPILQTARGCRIRPQRLSHENGRRPQVAQYVTVQAGRGICAAPCLPLPWPEGQAGVVPSEPQRLRQGEADLALSRLGG